MQCWPVSGTAATRPHPGEGTALQQQRLAGAVIIAHSKATRVLRVCRNLALCAGKGGRGKAVVSALQQCGCARAAQKKPADAAHRQEEEDRRRGQGRRNRRSDAASDQIISSVRGSDATNDTHSSSPDSVHAHGGGATPHDSRQPAAYLVCRAGPCCRPLGRPPRAAGHALCALLHSQGRCRARACQVCHCSVVIWRQCSRLGVWAMM